MKFTVEIDTSDLYEGSDLKGEIKAAIAENIVTSLGANTYEIKALAERKCKENIDQLIASSLQKHLAERAFGGKGFEEYVSERIAKAFSESKWSQSEIEETMSNAVAAHIEKNSKTLDGKMRDYIQSHTQTLLTEFMADCLKTMFDRNRFHATWITDRAKS